MMENSTVIAFIPARGGSKSIPRKNLAILGKKPLLQWTIEVAQQSNYIDAIYVSTDDEEIKNVSENLGVAVHWRSTKNSTDDALVANAVKEFLQQLKELPEYLVLLEPTAPFRTTQDIDACISKIKAERLDSVATYTEAALNPHRAWKLEGDTMVPFVNNANPWLPRQKLPKAYQLNGAVYVVCVRSFLESNDDKFVLEKSGAHYMPAERSLDIDHPIDLLIANALLEGENIK